MRRTLRPAATAFAIAAVFAGTSGCSAARKSNRVSDGPASSSAAAAPTSPAAVEPQSSAHITQAAFNEDGDGARLVVSADVALVYTSYEPRPDLLVVDMPNVSTAEGFVAPQAGGALVTGVRVETIEEFGKHLTRLSVEHQPGARYELRSVGRGLAVAFEATRTDSEPTRVAAAGEPPLAPAPAVVTEPIAPPSAAAEPAAPPALVRAELAHELEEVTAETTGESVAVHLLGDGNLQPRDFVLDNPPRVVVDLPGVKNSVRRKVIAVKGGPVSRVRVSQFQSAPDPVTRIVLDLVRPTPYAVHVDGERLSVVVAGAPTESAAANPVVEPEPAVVLAEKTAPQQPPPTNAAEPAPAPSRTEIVPDVPAAATTDAATTAAPPPAIAPPPVAEPAPAPVASRIPPSAQKVEPLPAGAPLPPGVRVARKSTPKAPEQPAGKEDALFEAAAAVLAQQEPVAQSGELAAFQSRTLAEGQTQFTGEPISLDLKDADIKDVFRTISQLTGLNIVIDPEVKGTVTVQLENVPWDQALDLILKQNSLGYVLENNIMRIATTRKLQDEEVDRARLAEARQSAEPTRTVIKKLSYARAVEITPVLKSIMSRRGDIVIDARTNTLIIREIPTFLPAVLQLIDNLDTATPQVIIESRIVETTKTLGRSLGINWGFTGSADVDHGNSTNLVFPNNVKGGIRVGLENGPVVGQIRLGNILDTFNLDLSLTAAENQGLLKIISSPKLAALTNTPALIQSGVQIPVQTTVNNTTTVIYVDATLRLEVTPQITAEGTILLNVVVQKREPAVALNLSLGNNVPLTIREYRGQVLVRDGGTTVIGGIFQINDQDQNNMIPGLWKIPILGNLFRNKTRTEKHDELLIFITPRILR
jgi:type IV pilus assembly protein PilQ